MSWLSVAVKAHNQHHVILSVPGFGSTKSDEMESKTAISSINECPFKLGIALASDVPLEIVSAGLHLSLRISIQMVPSELMFG